MASEDPPRSTLKNVGKAIVATTTVVASVVAILAAVGVFGGSDADALAQAAQKATDAGSSRVVITRTLRAGSKQQTQKLSGAFDYRLEAGYLNSVGADRAKLVFARPYVYESGPGTMGAWCRYNLSVLGSGFFFGAITGFKNDPAAALVNLDKSGESEKKGDETLFGVKTTRYAGRVDLDKLANRVSDPARRKLLEGLAAYNKNGLPIDVWLGEDGFPRRLKAVFSVPGTDYGVDGIVNFNATIDFAGFGAPVHVKVPAKTHKPGTHGCPTAP